jgi:disulfide bond formation protein DsbB
MRKFFEIKWKLFEIMRKFFEKISIFDLGRTRYSAAAFIIAVVATFIIAGAWFFQLVIGLIPCELCLAQRIPYYAGIPLAIVLAFFARDPRRSTLARLWLLLLAGLFGYGAGVGVYHAGVEWGFWPGPTTCSGARLPSAGGDLLAAIKRTRVVSCDEVQWRFLGLSMAGYNVLIAGALAAFALWTASKKSNA